MQTFALPRSPSTIEPLEARIAPAVILQFVDAVDGDIVQLVSNKALTASVSFAANGSPSEILLSGAGLDGANVTTVVKKVPGGDGVVNVGRIVATGLDLGTVTVKGDLGKIVSGNAGNPLPGLKALKVRSMGVLGIETQGSGDLISVITGDLGALTMAGDMNEARIIVGGKAGVVKIGGDVRGGVLPGSGRIQAGGFVSVSIGGDLIAGAGDESGKIVVTGDLGKLTIRGSVYGARDAVADDLVGQIDVTGKSGPIFIGRDVFGAVSEQKVIDVTGDAGAITVGGSLYGSSGTYSATIAVGGKAGAVKIGRDVRGSNGDFSASILVEGTVGGLNIGGSVYGGTGRYQDGVTSQQIAVGGSTGPVRIVGEVRADTGRGSGTVLLGSGAPSFFLGGSIIGGGTEVTNILAFPGGSVAIGDVKKVTIGGDIRESAFSGGGFFAGNVGTLLIKGSLFAAPEYGTTTGGNLLLFAASVGKLRIEGSVYGTPDFSGTSETIRLGTVGAMEILGSVAGGGGAFSGSIFVNGTAGSIKILGSLLNGAGGESGGLVVGGKLGALTVGGNVQGGGGGFSVAQVIAPEFGKVNIRGDVTGSFRGVNGFASITVGGSVLGATISSLLSLGVVKIGGSAIANSANNSAVLVGGDAKSIAIGGDAIGNGGTNSAILFIAQGAGKITIGGDLRSNVAAPALLLFGYLPGFVSDGFKSLAVKGDIFNAVIGSGMGANLDGGIGDARLGTVTVGGDFIASSILAGIEFGADGDFGTPDDAPVTNATPALSRIAAVTIKGQVFGTAAMDDHFGIVAQQIGPVKVGGKTFLVDGPIALDSLFDDVSLRLV